MVNYVLFAISMICLLFVSMHVFSEIKRVHDSISLLNDVQTKNLRNIDSRFSTLEHELHTYLGNLANVQDVRELSADERARLAWKESFDSRINDLKNELDALVAERDSRNPAQEMHPDVKNLPHHLVQPKSTYLPDVEIAD